MVGVQGIIGSGSTPPGDDRALEILGGREGPFLLSVLTASQECVKLLDPDGRITFMTENGLRAMEIDTFASVESCPWPDLWPAPLRPLLHEALDRARAGERSSFEAECPTAKGTMKWWHVSVLPIRDAGGTVDKILASSRDITERVLRERDSRAYALTLERELAEKSELLTQRDFLMREVDHRVKNSLAQVASILRLQARRSSADARGALDEAARRVASIARVHEQLQSSGDMRSIPVIALIRRLCSELALSLDRQIDVPADDAADLPMLSERASALCIILSELVANAARHGVGSDPIRVNLDHIGQGPAVARLCVRNAATGPRPDPTAREAGLGSLICETYAATLSGQLDWTFAEGQMVARLVFSPEA